MRNLFYIILLFSFLLSSCGRYTSIQEAGIVTSIDSSLSVDVGEIISINFSKDIDAETVNVFSLFVVKSDVSDSSSFVRGAFLSSSNESSNASVIADRCEAANAVLSDLFCTSARVCQISPELEEDSRYYLCITRSIRHSDGKNIFGKVISFVTGSDPVYSVSYDGNTNTGGTSPVDSNRYLEGESVTVLGPSSLVKTGYSFAAWNTAADGSGTDYSVGSELIMPAENLDLYARWESGSCTITNFSIASQAATIIGTDISLELPWGTDRTSLIADFITTGVEVTVGGLVQQSGVTANDFTNPLVYLVEAEDGSLCTYDVDVTAEEFNPNTVSYWKFDEGSGLVASDSVGSNDGGIINATWGARGLDFNGTNARVEVPDNPSLNPTDEITLSAWVKWEIVPSTGNGWATIINKNVDSQYRLQHKHDNTAFEFAIRTPSGGKWVDSATIPIINTWYHVVGTYDGSTLKIYVNGVLENSNSHSGVINTSTTNLSIGSRSIGDRHFNGSIEKVSIYDKALSEQEVQKLYQGY